jgi:hypothetical protein
VDVWTTVRGGTIRKSFSKLGKRIFEFVCFFFMCRIIFWYTLTCSTPGEVEISLHTALGGKYVGIGYYVLECPFPNRMLVCLFVCFFILLFCIVVIFL